MVLQRLWAGNGVGKAARQLIGVALVWTQGESDTLGFDLAAQLQDRLAQDLAQRPTRSRRTGWSLLGWMPTGLAAGAALVSGVWLGGLLLGAGAALPAASPAMARVFDPVPPGGLCAAAEICRLPRTLP